MKHHRFFTLILLLISAHSATAAWDLSFESTYPGYPTTCTTATGSVAYFSDTDGRVRKWTSASGWSLVTSYQFDSTIRFMSVSGSHLFVSGDFTTATSGGVTITLNKIARITISSGAVTALGTGIQGRIDEMVVASTASEISWNLLYVGGLISSAGGTAAYNIAAWNPVSGFWSPLNGGLPIVSGGSALEGVHSLGVNLVWTGTGYNHKVIAAGRFNEYPNAAYWDETYGGSWFPAPSSGVGSWNYDSNCNLTPITGVHDQAVTHGAFLNGTLYFKGFNLKRIGTEKSQIPNCTEPPFSCPCLDFTLYGRLTGTSANPSFWNSGKGWGDPFILITPIATGGSLYGIASFDSGATYTVAKHTIDTGAWADLTGGGVTLTASSTYWNPICKTTLGLFVAGENSAKRWQ